MCFGYGLGSFSVVWGVGVCVFFLLFFFVRRVVVGGGGGGFNGPRKDKSYAYLPNLAVNQMGQNYKGLKVKVLNVRR